MDPVQADELSNELERLATNALLPEAQKASKKTTKEEVDLWVRLFRYAPQQASYLITKQRLDITRARVPDFHWEIIKEKREALGYNKEAYEHELSLCELFSSQGLFMSCVSQGPGDAIFVFRLGGLLGTAEGVMIAAGLENAPKVIKGRGENGEADFCFVDASAKERIDNWLGQARARRDIGQSVDSSSPKEAIRYGAVMPQFSPT